LLKVGGTFDGIYEIGYQICAALVLALQGCKLIVHAFTLANQTVISANNTNHKYEEYTSDYARY
jgi:hypothetical protein